MRRAKRGKEGGKAQFRYVRKSGRTACCAICSLKLAGGREKAKSKRRVSRIFGGVLCPRCSFDVLKLAGKVRAAHMKLDDVDLERRKFVRQAVGL